MLSRRAFMALAAAAGAGGYLRGAGAEVGATRRYHVCLSSKVIAEKPELLDVVRDAGVSDIWLAAYFYGFWYETPARLRETAALVMSKGLQWHLINVPLGHPGDSLGDSSGETPLTPPGHWQMAVRPDGSSYSGTSLHPPGTEENVVAVRELAALRPDVLFLDDDFRLATGPGVIGGCFCDVHKQAFLRKHGFGAERWDELLGDVAGRRLTPLLRAWVDDTCDQLTGSFRAQQAAAPDVALGNMIMYLGAEKAGIRLADYADAPFRVGELMFNDASFSKVKGKTDELFSALFHRRYAKPDLAYSETTAYPADQLSAKNMAAKLAVSTIADVRNTMFMSGLTPFPTTHWEVLAPAMRKHAEIHETLKGHRLRGPLKHYWGEAARYAGDDRPYSLFLALGIPFEVTGAIDAAGWTFLSDDDARHFDVAAQTSAGRLVCRPEVSGAPEGVRGVDESLDALWPLKREIVAGGLDVPYVVDEKPVICAWYPSAGAVLLWNLAEQSENFGVQWKGKMVEVTVAALDVALVPLQGV